MQLRRPGSTGQGQLDPPPVAFPRFRLLQGQFALKLPEGPGALAGPVQQKGKAVALGRHPYGQPCVQVGGCQGAAPLLEPNQHPVQHRDNRFVDQAAYLIQCLGEGFCVYRCSHAAFFLLVLVFCSSGRTLTVWVEKVTRRTVLLPVARML